MPRTRLRLATSSALAVLFALPLSSRAADEPIGGEYHVLQVRLAAHRRELMKRESELDAAQLEIRNLKQRDEKLRKRPVAAAEPATPLIPETPPPPPIAAEVPPTAASADADTQAAAIASLQHDLDLERERRSTLEQEVERLAAEPRAMEQLEPLRRTVESASAQILVLRQQAVAEKQAREALEVDLEHARQIAGVPPGADWLDRFATAMKERRDQSVRLEQQLADAGESIVALKARLESMPTGAPEVSDPAALRDLEAQNSKLRLEIAASEQANADLRTQAELAQQLAEMLYGQQQP